MRMFSSAEAMVTGSVAAELFVKRATARAGGHGFHDADRVEAADEEKERQNDEELDEVSGHDDSHIIRATHSGILTSVNSTAASATVSPLTQRSPTPHTYICSLSFGLYLSPVKFSAQRRSTSELLRTL